MKGDLDQPACGFSRAVVQILEMQGVPREKVKTYNVLADPELRTGIKEYSSVLASSRHAAPILIPQYL
jgi:monothiol glutaredoxin